MILSLVPPEQSHGRWPDALVTRLSITATDLARCVYRGEVVRVMLMIENKIALLAVFCFFLAIVVWIFWAYHMWLTATNMTTNESIKRGRVRARILSACLLRLS